MPYNNISEPSGDIHRHTHRFCRIKGGLCQLKGRRRRRRVRILISPALEVIDTADSDKRPGERTSPADFALSLQPSPLAAAKGDEHWDSWLTAPSLSQSQLSFGPAVFVSVSTHLLANPNLISPSLFRADILHDSAGVLATTTAEHEHDGPAAEKEAEIVCHAKNARLPLCFPGFDLDRVVVRRLIPRNPNLDPPHDQTCHLYQNTKESDITSHLAVYYPHAAQEKDIPFYHPLVRGFALLYSHSTSTGQGTLSLHFLPFPPGIPTTVSNRLHRTLLNLLSIHVRLASGPAATSHPSGSQPRPFKDNLIPQHTVQNTYTRLKSKYAPSLVRNWVEVTEPSKHVFEDLSIAAFLIELWNVMYHLPSCSSDSTKELDEGTDVMKRDAPAMKTNFPGFVDIACGNGVLVYILLAEGYQGFGFDARSRKTWSIFPPWVQQQLKESICVPQPYKDVLGPAHSDDSTTSSISGLFKSGTFIISNHADELTLWTPLLGVLSSPSQPLPFLAIPCCSHGLSGARYRYPPPKHPKTNTAHEEEAENDRVDEHEHQPQSGDLKALREKKLESQQNPASASSTYGSLTAKLVCIAEEVGYQVEKTLMRIPSTRNMGVIGGLEAWKTAFNLRPETEDTTTQITRLMDQGLKLDADKRREKVYSVVERETSRDGGIGVAAMAWVERSTGLLKGQGRGRLHGSRSDHHD
ncbi:hypothetical protein H112_08751 [Trichophyton rubrum D6]|uniref:tRNA (uracil-O(2)-)-methyltransferase n=4 Tax=Trichophyton TaxID=5550 RepID=A0A178ESE8_TRIRU|nr:uncharacterized protein TERG_01299 [Trichophyton rubrum CBS 118892]EZF09876.1 hypothetical protein H100_08773 [Trichophyton rubrum MR850]EZF47476.1 hypothetical protein H103_08755 [Trichophyton rubrum CBS 288.86]EZF58133.1 hypothetical protein H104_08706 [Trichophyton rubrum CBS 289.86]EZF68740.1 hypothetical protein H105_08758 [Trichophyton soudanense CBS 452.61]EZF79299.1 hypothetical protein H110_08757 [Trichophyton rubrum MR1448]EZF90191.1 hypothetical protein H113_08824 [Trichophyton 